MFIIVCALDFVHKQISRGKVETRKVIVHLHLKGQNAAQIAYMIN